MMKLTVAFLASLAAADAAGYRRDGGYGTGNHGTGVLPSSHVKPTESHSAPYTHKTPEATETSFHGDGGYAASSPIEDETKDPSSTLGHGHGHPSSAPEAEESSYPVYEGTGGLPTFKFTGTGGHPHPTGRPHHGTGVEDVTSASEAYPVKTPASEIEHVITETLVYTVGTGSHAHPVTTEIVETSTETVYKTIFVTKHGHGETPVETAIPTKYEHGDYEEGTTTLKTTSTTTKFITVYPTPSAVDVTGEEVSPAHGGQGGPQGPAHGQGEGECGAPVTVTVTAQETVTVTEKFEYPEHTPVEDAEHTPPSGHPHGPHGGDITKTYEHPIPTEFPTSSYSANTTYPFPTGPSGFLTHTKPSYPHGTGVSDHELPPFSEYPSHTGSPIEETEKPEYSSYPESSPVEDTEQTAYPPAATEYGSY